VHICWITAIKLKLGTQDMHAKNRVRNTFFQARLMQIWGAKLVSDFYSAGLTYKD
jgi:hypothetical protein